MPLDPIDLCVMAPPEDESTKAKAREEMNLALAESLAYEESVAWEVAMQRLRLDTAKEYRREEMEKLNEATLATIQAAIATKADADLRAVMERALSHYTQRAAEVEAAGAVGGLCRSCREFHASSDGLCSACTLRGCMPAIVSKRVVSGFLRLLKVRRKKLPSVPSAEARVSGRRLVEDRLKAHAMKIRDVRGDGACQFRAVAHQLFDDERHHPLVRQRAIAWLTSNPPDVHDCEVYVSKSGGVVPTPVGEDLQAYLAALKSDAAWGDACTLQACADAFKVRIYLVTSYKTDFELVLEPENHEPALRDIWLGFYAEMHYIAVSPL